MIVSSPISKALMDIHYTIPKDILVLAFSNDPLCDRNSSIDELLRVKVIQYRVIPDCDIVGGQEIIVSLEGLLPRGGSVNSTVYHVPKERTNGRSIISVSEVMPIGISTLDGGVGSGTTVTGGGGGAACGGYNGYPGYDSLTNAVQGMESTVTKRSPFLNARTDVIGENVILIRYQTTNLTIGAVRCHIQNEEDLTNIHPRSIIHFSNLCQLAVKSYIYTQLVNMVNKDIYNNQLNTNYISDYVNDLKDAEEQYQEYLKLTWEKVSVMNDTETYSKLIRMQINPFGF